MMLLYAILWALWRRAFGGWMSLRRSLLVAAIPVMLAPFWFTLSYSVWAFLTVVTIAFFTLGHDYAKWTIVLRYPVLGGWYPICKRFWKEKWNRPPFIDGWTAVAELLIGFSFGILLGGVYYGQ